MTVYAINANTLAISEYSQDLLGIAELNGSTYSVTATSMYELTGADDNGTAIAGYVDTGYQEPSVGMVCTAPRLYGDWIASKGGTTTVTSVQGQQEKSIPYTMNTTRANERTRNGVVKLKRGPRARWWSVKIANKSGGTLDLYSLELGYNPLPRRV